MRVLLFFSPSFLPWALAIARELKAEDPTCQIHGLVSGPASMLDHVAAARGVEISPLHHLDVLEREWLSRPIDQNKAPSAVSRLDNNAIQRLIIADRDLGRGFVSGGITAETQLARMVRAPELLDRYIHGLLDYVDRVLNHGGVDLVFCHSVASAPALALGLMSKRLSIPFAQLRHTRIAARVTLDTSPFDDLDPVREAFERIMLTGQFPPGSREAADAYLAAARTSEAKALPDYLDYHKKRVRRQRHPAHLARRAMASLRAELRVRSGATPLELRRPSPLGQFTLEIKAAIQTRKLLARGIFLEPNERPSNPFAFFPLHVDPEASTMVQSPMHTDQLSLVEAVAKSLPPGMHLMVKEHIPMLGRRPDGFYERLAAMPSVQLASPFDSGTTLAKEACLTTVISSTAGWEAMLFGKPTVIMAYPPYGMVNDGFVHCPDISRLPDAIDQALAAGPADERRLLAYVAAVFSSSFDCPTEALWGQVTTDSVAAQPQLLAAMVERIRSLANSRTLESVSSLKPSQLYG